MIAQIINLSHPSANKKISFDYKIPFNLKDNYALEIRSITEKEADLFIGSLKAQNFFKRIDENNLANILVSGKFSDLNFLMNNLDPEVDKEIKHEINLSLKRFSGYNEIVYQIGNKNFSFNKVYVMGILNVTPDSFSDGGKYFDQNLAYEHAVQMITEGADIIDIGGESTRPGSNVVSSEEEMNRILPVIEKIHSSFPDAIISIDTTKSNVADEALKLGAKIVNDISGTSFDERMTDVVKEHDAALIIMHMKGSPKDMQKNPHYVEVVKEIYDYLYSQTIKAFNKGIKKIFVDPGIGFGKTIEHNFEILQRLEDFKSLGYPIVIGVSRKSFIGKTLNLEPEERDTATSIVESASIMNGARIIRTHNIKNGVQVKKLLNELI